mgnify:CR=1 FL=1
MAITGDRRCPHDGKDLRLVSETERVDGVGKVTVTEKYRCSMQGCGYTYTHSAKS